MSKNHCTCPWVKKRPGCLIYPFRINFTHPIYAHDERYGDIDIARTLAAYNYTQFEFVHPLEWMA